MLNFKTEDERIALWEKLSKNTIQELTPEEFIFVNTLPNGLIHHKNALLALKMERIDPDKRIIELM